MISVRFYESVFSGGSIQQRGKIGNASPESPESGIQRNPISSGTDDNGFGRLFFQPAIGHRRRQNHPDLILRSKLQAGDLLLRIQSNPGGIKSDHGGIIPALPDNRSFRQIGCPPEISGMDSTFEYRFRAGSIRIENGHFPGGLPLLRCPGKSVQQKKRAAGAFRHFECRMFQKIRTRSATHRQA